MFGKEKTTMAFNSNGNTTTLIAKGTEIVGDIKFNGNLEIEGRVCGNVIVGAGADDASVRVLEHGEVEGNIFAYDRLEVTDSAKVIGDITSPRISIAEGVIFEGKCTMKPPGDAKPAITKDNVIQAPTMSKTPKAEVEMKPPEKRTAAN